PVFPTQEVIDISSGSNDDHEPQPQPIKILLEIGISNAPGTQDQPPTTLDKEFPLTARTMAVINSMDEHVIGPEPTTATPQTTQVIEDDFDEMIVGLMCHMLNREEGNRYEKLVYCLPPEILPMLNEFKKKLVMKIVMSKENSMRADAIATVQNMRVTRPTAAF
ncbi:hypothetical protein PIB30_019605, partial [Stylosanthes scabra]|nr:hypothetical protein [Stylosanthes scabra]